MLARCRGDRIALRTQTLGERAELPRLLRALDGRGLGGRALLVGLVRLLAERALRSQRRAGGSREGVPRRALRFVCLRARGLRALRLRPQRIRLLRGVPRLLDGRALLRLGVVHGADGRLALLQQRRLAFESAVRLLVVAEGGALGLEAVVLRLRLFAVLLRLREGVPRGRGVAHGSPALAISARAAAAPASALVRASCSSASSRPVRASSAATRAASAACSRSRLAIASGVAAWRRSICSRRVRAASLAPAERLRAARPASS